MRIFETIKLVIRNICEAENVFSITSDCLGCLSEEKDAIGRSHIKLKSLKGLSISIIQPFLAIFKFQDYMSNSTTNHLALMISPVTCCGLTRP